MRVKTKFKVKSVTVQASLTGPGMSHSIRLVPVIPNESDEDMSRLTSGSIDLVVAAGSVDERFPVGKDFYVEFTPA